MNVQEKINKMENCRGKNHDLLEFRQWLTDAMPDHTALKKIQVAGTNGKGSTSIWLRDLLMKKGYIFRSKLERSFLRNCSVFC